MKPRQLSNHELATEIDALGPTRSNRDELVAEAAKRLTDEGELLTAVEKFEEYNRVDFIEDADIIQKYQDYGEILEGWVEVLADVDPDPEAEERAVDYLRGIVERYKEARLWVCQDCLLAIANDDYSGLDYDLPPEIAKRRAADIRSAIAKYRVLAPGDGELGFSTRPCDCCADHLHGARYAVFDVDKVP